MGQTQFGIDELMNYDSVYFRDLTIAFKKTWSQKIWWFNRFTDKTVLVTVPFYYSMTGDERFLYDAFVDDTVGKRVELNTDQIPRGHLVLTSIVPNFSELANPHTWLKSSVDTDAETFRIISKVMAIPITATYDLEILLDSETDIMKCVAKIMNTIQIFKFFDLEHKGIYVEAVMKMPEGTEITIPRENNMSSESKISLKYSIEVKTHYPVIDLNWDGNLNSLLTILGIDPNDPNLNSGVIEIGNNIEANSFGTAYFPANKRVNWKWNINKLNVEILPPPPTPSP